MGSRVVTKVDFQFLILQSPRITGTPLSELCSLPQPVLTSPLCLHRKEERVV